MGKLGVTVEFRNFLKRALEIELKPPGHRRRGGFGFYEGDFLYYKTTSLTVMSPMYHEWLPHTTPTHVRVTSRYQQLSSTTLRFGHMWPGAAPKVAAGSATMVSSHSSCGSARGAACRWLSVRSSPMSLTTACGRAGRLFRRSACSVDGRSRWCST